MIVLGLAGGLSHDASAALVVDGRLVAFAEEERFNRQKRARATLPLEAVAYCLSAGGITMADVDVLATSWIEADRDDRHRDMQDSVLAHPYFGRGRRPRWEQVRHPVAHAYASYVASGLEEATVISADGVGDGVATLVGHMRDGRLDVLRELPISESLGMFYLGLTNYLGFAPGQEGKVMGLACYGTPDDDWMPFALDGGGAYATGLHPLGVDRPNYGRPVMEAWVGRFAERFGPRLHPCFSYSAGSGHLEASIEVDPHRARVAAVGQGVLERVILHLVAGAVAETGCPDLVVGGGVGLNCSANGACWRSDPVRRLELFPASGDAGTSAGAALAVAAEAGELERCPLGSAALGPSFDDDDIRAVLDDAGVPYVVVDDVADTAAELLTDGMAIGWFQGRAEAGPRALCQRSILASPTSRAMHRRVNGIKAREQWRPLAPTMTEAAAARFLVDPGPSRFMLTACQVSDAGSRELPAVVHVDGSCRPQIVEAGSSTAHGRLLRALGERGHPEVVLNTSFNLASEPIVHSPIDALRSFYASGLDALAIGSMVVRKRSDR